jgi:signal transduction histidine kinase
MLPDLPPLDAATDLKTVLAAWHSATVRLERTHAVLRDEVRRLTDELAAKNRELARKNRLADLGRMASHIAHEVRNSLVPISLYISLLRRRLTHDGECLDVVNKIAAGITSLEATVSDLLHFTADREPRRRTVQPAIIVRDVLESLAPQLAAQRISTEVDVSPRVFVWADGDMLRRAVLNLVLNALDVMPEGGELTITCVEAVRRVELEIADSGPGLSDEVRRQIFEPFFTTKSGGTGLGLAIVQRIAEAHGGSVAASNCPQGGAAFTLSIPRPAMEKAA